jgi:hypothetical protein
MNQRRPVPVHAKKYDRHTWQYMARRVSRAREFVFASPWADKKQFGNHLSKCTCVGTTLFSDLKIFRWAVPGWQQCKDPAFAPSGLCCFKLPGCMLWSLQHLNIALQRSAVRLFLLWSRLRLYILFRLMEPVLHISRMWPQQVVHQGQLTFVAPKALAFGIASFCTGMENDWRSGRKTIFQVPWSIIVSPLSGVRLLVAHR